MIYKNYTQGAVWLFQSATQSVGEDNEKKKKKGKKTMQVKGMP
jgi:hypothetical protein